MITIEKHGIILSPTKNRFENKGVLNPGIYQEDNNVHIFYRAVEDGYLSTIGYAKTDGPIRIVVRKINLTTSNLRNQFNLSMEYGWNQNLEAEFSYEYYLYDYMRVFGGVNVENITRNNLDEMKTIAVAGIRWFTPYMFNVDLRVDNELRPRIGIGRSLMVFPKFSLFGFYEYQFDAGLVNSLETGQNFKEEIVWSAGAQYMLSKNFSLLASYDNRFGAGGGLSIMF
jgi:hypothetical protein